MLQFFSTIHPSRTLRTLSLACCVASLAACGEGKDFVDGVADALGDGGLTTGTTGTATGTTGTATGTTGTSTSTTGTATGGTSTSTTGTTGTATGTTGTSTSTTGTTGTSTSTTGSSDGGVEDASIPPEPEGEDPFGGLFGDGGLLGGEMPTEMTPPPADGQSGGWTLKADSSAECPAEPPPTPIDPCLGVYWACGWEHADGRTYTCICDWIHYLCI